METWYVNPWVRGAERMTFMHLCERKGYVATMKHTGDDPPERAIEKVEVVDANLDEVRLRLETNLGTRTATTDWALDPRRTGPGTITVSEYRSTGCSVAPDEGARLKDEAQAQCPVIDYMSMRGGRRDYDVRCDRRHSRWGNKFVVGRGYSHGEAVEAHRRWLWTEIDAGRIDLRALAKLAGKRLGCWCGPSKQCHTEELGRAAHYAAMVVHGMSPVH